MYRLERAWDRLLETMTSLSEEQRRKLHEIATP